jgi:hypothetical protein
MNYTLHGLFSISSESNIDLKTIQILHGLLSNSSESNIDLKTIHILPMWGKVFFENQLVASLLKHSPSLVSALVSLLCSKGPFQHRGSVKHFITQPSSFYETGFSFLPNPQAS